MIISMVLLKMHCDAYYLHIYIFIFRFRRSSEMLEKDDKQIVENLKNFNTNFKNVKKNTSKPVSLGENKEKACQIKVKK